MPALNDLTGLRFGKIVVVRRVGSIRRKNSTSPTWLCKCDCGVEVVKESALVKVYQSCGCFQRQQARRSPGTAGMTDMYHCYKKNAKNDGLAFALSKREFMWLTSQDCFYCGAEPSGTWIAHGKRSEASKLHEAYSFNGLDRVDSNAGYEASNVVPCCKWCNYAKRERTLTEFKEWTERLASNVGNWDSGRI